MLHLPLPDGEGAAPRLRRSSLLRLAPFAVFVALAAGVVLSWSLFRDEQRSLRDEQDQLLARQLGHRLEEYVGARLAVLESLRDQRAAGLMADPASFADSAEDLLSMLGGLTSIAWIDADGQVQSGAQPGGVLSDPAIEEELIRAQALGEPTLSPPLDDGAGGLALVALYPAVEHRSGLPGCVAGVFAIEPLVAACMAKEQPADHVLELHDGAQPLYASANASQLTDEDVTHGHVHLLDRTWDLAVASLPGAQATWLGEGYGWMLLGGLALSGFLAVLLGLTLQTLERDRLVAQARMELEARFQRSQRLETVGQLAGGIAHDFNNVLTAILGNADIALRSPDLAGKHRAAIEQVIASAERASSLTKRLLSFSRQQVLRRRRLHLNAELLELRPMLERLVRADVRLEFDLTAEEDRVELDPGQISQIALNLILNAVDAMPRGGKLFVSTRLTDRSRRGKPGDWIVLTVRDDGEGMDQATLDHALEPFFTTKPVGQGTGLGLSIVYGEVRAAGGELELRSELGRGTEVEVFLPRLEEPAWDSRRPQQRVAVDGDARVVLLVEDDAAVLEVSTQALHKAGHEVRTAANGHDALQVAAGLERLDVVVTDAVMPEMGGTDLVQALREHLPELPAVVMSGYSQELLRAQQALGDAVYLPKPFSAAQLVEAVGQACAARPEPAQV
ncbi:MAG: response regulator [Planctomycetes bacterium]|nr:response regulator [Planctomycetota bacterium]